MASYGRLSFNSGRYKLNDDDDKVLIKKIAFIHYRTNDSKIAHLGKKLYKTNKDKCVKGGPSAVRQWQSFETMPVYKVTFVTLAIF